MGATTTTTEAARPLVDSFGRVHRDLRISVTDRCNFRCTYCMPVEGMTWLPREEVLTFEEVERIARLLVERHGVNSIRLTGGEPTVRAHLPVLVGKLAALPVDLSLTTNGATLAAVAPDLAAAGLRRVNVSLDSLRPERFEELTRRDELSNVLAGIEAAVAAGLSPVKVNVVVLREVNDDEIVDLARYGRDRGVTIRFIEFMPLDGGGAWRPDQVVTQAEILGRIEAAFPLEPLARGHAPAERFRYLDGAGEVGVIPSVTRPFCDQCDRIRLTADGQLRSCLFSLDDHDLRTVVRSGGSDDDLSDAIEACVGSKWAGHAINQVQFVRPRRSMSQIGG
ncbi:MAG: GTP 3',8-cyclase MoaA [Acidimicrobiales bacterium]|nr:GTP 3',8-cyclase MoaA [Acidimicrobiales bacterium]